MSRPRPRSLADARLTDVAAQRIKRDIVLGLSVRDRTTEMRHEHTGLVDSLTAGDPETTECVSAGQIEAEQKMVLEGLFHGLSTVNIASTRPRALTFRREGRS